MRPYLAVIQDSFREAIASRVLWIVLALIVLFLLAIAPFGYQQQLTTGFDSSDVRDWPRLVERLREARDSQRRSPARHVWQLLEKDAQEAVEQFQPLGERPKIAEARQFENNISEITSGLRNMLESSQLHQADIWREAIVGEEAARMLKEPADSLEPQQQKRLNRLLLEAAFPGLIRRSPPISMQLRYATFEMGPPMPVSQDQLASNLRSALPWLIDKGLLSIGLLVAILVTASIIPQTFEPGSLHLLLSKPISRWMLFLAKFVGGCAFILLCISCLFVGMWLVLGLRMDIWEHGLLLSIPIYVFVFAIYYSVSAMAGVVWRNAIVAIVVAMLFWLMCFVVGLAKEQLESFLDRFRINQVLEAEGTVISTNQSQLVYQWNQQDGQWEQIMQSDEQAVMGPALLFVSNLMPMTGPVYDPQRDQLLMGHFSFETGQPILYIGSREATEDPEESPNWKLTAGPMTPPASLRLFLRPDGQAVMVSQLGLFLLEGDATQQATTFFGFRLPLLGSAGFEEFDFDPPLVLDMPADAAMDPRSGELAVYSRGELTILRPSTENQYERGSTVDLPVAQGEPAALAMAGNSVVVAFGDGQILLLDRANFETRAKYRPEGKESPRFVYASPEGEKYAILFHNGRLWLLDPASKRLQLAAVAGQGEISAAHLPDERRLLVADRIDRVMQYELPGHKLVEQYEPPSGTFARLYRYAILPLYTIFPKPGEMYQTVQYVLTEEESTASGAARLDLSKPRERLDPWTPVWSSLGFIAVVLALTCVYIERQDF